MSRQERLASRGFEELWCPECMEYYLADLNRPGRAVCPPCGAEQEGAA